MALITHLQQVVKEVDPLGRGSVVVAEMFDPGKHQLQHRLVLHVGEKQGSVCHFGQKLFTEVGGVLRGEDA